MSSQNFEVLTKEQILRSLLEKANNLPESLDISPMRDLIYEAPTYALEFKKTVTVSGTYNIDSEYEFSHRATDETEAAIRAGLSKISVAGQMDYSNGENSTYRAGIGIKFPFLLCKKKGYNDLVLLEDLEFFKEGNWLIALYQNRKYPKSIRTWVRILVRE